MWENSWKLQESVSHRIVGISSILVHRNISHHSQTSFHFLHILMEEWRWLQTVVPYQENLPSSFSWSYLSMLFTECSTVTHNLSVNTIFLASSLTLNCTRYLWQQKTISSLSVAMALLLVHLQTKLHYLRKKWSADVSELGRLGHYLQLKDQNLVMIVAF